MFQRPDVESQESVPKLQRRASMPILQLSRPKLQRSKSSGRRKSDSLALRKAILVKSAARTALANQEREQQEEEEVELSLEAISLSDDEEDEEDIVIPVANSTDGHDSDQRDMRNHISQQKEEYIDFVQALPSDDQEPMPLADAPASSQSAQPVQANSHMVEESDEDTALDTRLSEKVPFPIANSRRYLTILRRRHKSQP